MRVNSRVIIRYILYAILLLMILAGIKFASVYQMAFRSNIRTPEGKSANLYIGTGAEYVQVLDSLNEHNMIINTKSFDWLARKKKYPDHVHPGHYILTQGMSNLALINMLRSGRQEPVNVVINVARTTEDLAARIALQVEPSRDDLLRVFDNDSLIKSYGFTRQSVLGMFIPNTYQFWWNTSAPELFKRIYREYNKFWNDGRLGKAKEIRLTPNQVITLASIVINETNRVDEYRRIAGVYINRLHRGIKLQADPTVKYALGDYERQRILKKDMEVKSPYNTYRVYGLPPGPIDLPSVKAIDAVLDYEKNDYLYFCAKEDFSGYHNFARTLAQHLKNARLYQKALNRRNILK